MENETMATQVLDREVYDLAFSSEKYFKSYDGTSDQVTVEYPLKQFRKFQTKIKKAEKKLCVSSR